MPTQGDAHVVHLDSDRVATEQAFVQQLDVRALDEAQLQQAPLQLDLMILVVTMRADLNDDAAIAASGLAEFDGVGHGAHYDDARRRSLKLTVIISCERFASSNDNRRRCD
jgi:hypothetical protein